MTKGEKKFIDSLRAMAANNDTQGSKAWGDLFEDGTLLFGSEQSDLILRLEVFMKDRRRSVLVLHISVARLLRPNKVYALTSYPLHTPLIMSDHRHPTRVGTKV